MEQVSIDAVDPAGGGGTVERHGLSDPLDTADVAINHYRLPPGERLAGLHAHADQEEMFVVLAGTVTFETLPPRRGEPRATGDPAGTAGEPRASGDPAGATSERSVATGEAIRFAPGEFQSCSNDGPDPAVVLALGAPRHSRALRVPLTCPACGCGEMGLEFEAGEERLACPDCGEAVAPECPECGSEELRAVLADDGETPVSVCRDCGTAFEEL
jgi:transcription elongation factor Elf1